MSERTLLIDTEQFRALARPTSLHLDGEEVSAYTREAEDGKIIPAIGYEVYKYVSGEGGELPSALADSFDKAVFLDGGEYTETSSCDGKKALKYCNGLRKALAYYVWAKMLRSDGSIISRAGAMRHRDDYADHVDDSKLRQYNDASGMADRYLAEAVSYLKANTKDNTVRPLRNTRARIKAIGE